MRSFRILFGLVALLWIAPAFADEIRGTLLRVNPDKQEVAVDVRDRGRRSTSMILHVDADTQVMLGRKPGKLTDLVLGKRVRVLYETQNGQAIVRSIIAPAVITINPELLQTLGNLAGGGGINLGGLLNPTKGAAPAMPTTTVPNGIAGILRRVSRTDRELVILGDPGAGKPPTETTVFVPAEARITRDQRPISFDDLKEGEAAVVVAQSKEGRLEAQTVTIGQPVAGQAAPALAQPMPGDNKIAKLREALRLLDGILEQLDQQKGQPRP
jgi:hypothetical protein